MADFRLAKAAGGDDLTRTGEVVGALRYMAPERFQGQCDARSDVYSLGLTLYELLTLESPFSDSDPRPPSWLRTSAVSWKAGASSRGCKVVLLVGMLAAALLWWQAIHRPAVWQFVGTNQTKSPCSGASRAVHPSES